MQKIEIAIHTNGSNAQVLFDQVRAVGRAARELADAVAKASPKSRDYYPLGSEATTWSFYRHAVVTDSVKVVLYWAEEMCDAIMDAAATAGKELQ